mgnify:CR=1 FL=1
MRFMGACGFFVAVTCSWWSIDPWSAASSVPSRCGDMSKLETMEFGYLFRERCCVFVVSSLSFRRHVVIL